MQGSVLEDERRQGGGAVGAPHAPSWAHNGAAHGASPLACEPCADAGVTEEMAARQLDGRLHFVLPQSRHFASVSRSFRPPIWQQKPAAQVQA